MSDYIAVRDYDRLIEQLDTDFNRLLGIETVYNSGSKNESALVLQLTDFARRAQDFDHSPDLKRVQGLNMDFLRLRGLCNNLDCIATAQPNLLPNIKTKLLDSDEGNFYGTRLEIHIAANLIARQVPFTMPDPPDFDITWNGALVKLECVSLHLSRPKRDLSSLQLKVQDAISRKAGKGYCLPNSAVILDITNLQAHAKDDAHLLSSTTSLTDFVANVQAIGDTRFGAVIAVTWNYFPQKTELESGYVRHKEVDIDPALATFLDHAFPRRDELVIVKSAIPPLRT